MNHFSSGGVEIAYSVHGEGRPAVCLHGFCGTATDNFVRTGWITPLARAGRQVILMDARGHGESAKLYDPEEYAGPKLQGDVVALLDHLKVETADLIGFSMGGAISLGVAAHHPDRVGLLVVMGVGDAFYGSGQRREDTADALLAERDEDIPTERARAFRRYAESLGQDLRALAACSRAPRRTPALEEVELIRAETFFIVGSRDATAGGTEKLQAALPRARFLTVPGVDHVQTLSHGLVKGEVAEFLMGA